MSFQNVQAGNVIVVRKEGREPRRVTVTGVRGGLLTTTVTNPEVKHHEMFFSRETGQELGVNDGYRILPDTAKSTNKS